MSQFPCRQRKLAWVLAVAALVPAVLLSCRTVLSPVADSAARVPEREGQPRSVALRREVVTFRLDGKKIEGQAFYHFQNYSEVTRTFPAAVLFYVGAGQGPPGRLRFMQVTGERSDEIPFVWLEQNCPMAEIVVPPHETYCLRVDWEQDLTGNRFVYLLRRDPPWDARRPQIRLTLSAPRQFNRVQLNFGRVRRYKDDSRRYWVFSAEDFAPTEDFVATW